MWRHPVTSSIWGSREELYRLVEALCTSGRSQQLGMLAWDVSWSGDPSFSSERQRLSSWAARILWLHYPTSMHIMQMHMPKQPGGEEDTWKLKETSTGQLLTPSPDKSSKSRHYSCLLFAWFYLFIDVNNLDSTHGSWSDSENLEIMLIGQTFSLDSGFDGYSKNSWIQIDPNWSIFPVVNHGSSSFFHGTSLRPRVRLVFTELSQQVVRQLEEQLSGCSAESAAERLEQLVAATWIQWAVKGAVGVSIFPTKHGEQLLRVSQPHYRK